MLRLHARPVPGGWLESGFEEVMTQSTVQQFKLTDGAQFILDHWDLTSAPGRNLEPLSWIYQLYVPGPGAPCPRKELHKARSPSIGSSCRELPTVPVLMGL